MKKMLSASGWSNASGDVDAEQGKELEPLLASKGDPKKDGKKNSKKEAAASAPAADYGTGYDALYKVYYSATA
jgi:hypothetical protein